MDPRSGLLLSLVAATAPLSAQAATPQHLLHMAVPDGTTRWYRKSLSWRTQNGDAPPITSTMAATLESVTRVREDQLLVEQTVRRVVCRVTTEGIATPDLEYDSDVQTERKGFGVIVGRPVSLKLDPSGRARDLDVPKEFERLHPNWMLVVLGPVFHDKPVPVGGSWDAKARLEFREEATEVDVHHRLAVVDQGRATIRTEVPRELLAKPGVQVDRCNLSATVDLATGAMLAGEATLVTEAIEAGGRKKTVTFTMKTEAIEAPKPDARPAKTGHDAEGKRP
jgi:hypothetical protein